MAVTALPYIYRWNRPEAAPRKGQLCRVAARSRAHAGAALPIVAFGAPARPRFNSVAVVFADGFSMVTSGNAIRRVK